MKQVFTGIAELYPPRESLERAALAVQYGRCIWVGAEDSLPEEYRGWPRTDLGGRSEGPSAPGVRRYLGVVPGIAYAHTHLVYGGDRLGECLKRARGERYEAILAAGGGIYSTVQALFPLADHAARHRSGAAQRRGGPVCPYPKRRARPG